MDQWIDRLYPNSVLWYEANNTFFLPRYFPTLKKPKSLKQPLVFYEKNI